LIFANSTKLFSQSYSLDQSVLVPVFEGYAPSGISYRDYFWDITEISSTRLDLVVGVNQIKYATQYNYINGNWYKNQSDDNFNSENTNTRFIYQFGELIDPMDSLNYIRTITGQVLSEINNSSGKKDVVVSRGDSLFVFRNTSNSITTVYNQRFYFDDGDVHSSGRFTTDAVEDVLVHRNDSVLYLRELEIAHLIPFLFSKCREQAEVI
jgi:hypothetical protein